MAERVKKTSMRNKYLFFKDTEIQKKTGLKQYRHTRLQINRHRLYKIKVY